ncbi:hypothetical protein EJ08DRAFT_644378 [Tothia fuscella]|uniref:F-box domain-containing protein n=1 Tax=Tothia fuscella TaxID=1048955 RepID=A0A9P4U4K4_9PEZI|nr:hypothetical protein EJ08DRAFT_644378 [Tothia fuscella]
MALPNELHLMIMESDPNIAFQLVQTSSHFRTLYRSFHVSLMRGFLRRWTPEIQGIITALIHFRQRRTSAPPWSQQSMLICDFERAIADSLIPGLDQIMTGSDLPFNPTAAVSFYVEGLTEVELIAKLSIDRILTDTGIHQRLTLLPPVSVTDTESIRIYRAAWRLYFYSLLYQCRPFHFYHSSFIRFVFTPYVVVYFGAGQQTCKDAFMASRRGNNGKLLDFSCNFDIMFEGIIWRCLK